MNKKRIVGVIGAAALCLATLTACFETDAKVAGDNLSTAADQFELSRRIIFFNGITDKYIMVIEGKCSVDVNAGEKKLTVLCLVGDNQYKKHMLGLSDNMSWFMEQLESVKVSRYHYRVIFKPETIVPDIDRP